MKNAEGFKFMKAGQRQGNQQPRNNQQFFSNHSQRGSNHGGDLSSMNSGRRHYQPGGRPSFDAGNSSVATGGSNSARKLQPWSGLGAATSESQGASAATSSRQKKTVGGGRRPSDQQKPFSHLGASDATSPRASGNASGQKMYRPKAASHV